MTADEVIARLQLDPHPEGGHYRETWADTSSRGRPAGTAILFLLKAGERSHWHRVDATEIWHFHSGAPLELRMSPTPEGPATSSTLGADLGAGQMPQAIVPKDHWQSARSTGVWTLVAARYRRGSGSRGSSWRRRVSTSPRAPSA